MNTYFERAAAGLDCVWQRTSGTATSGRVVPDGRTDIIWTPRDGLSVAGPDTVGHVTALSPGEMFGVRFGPGVGPSALGVPAHVLRDLRVPLAELWDDVAALEDALAAAADPCAVLADAARHRLRTTPPDPLTGAIAGSAGTPVAALADDLGLSTRQLHRRSLDAFGYGPKTLHRVLRFDRAVKLAWTGAPFADIAHRTGYADQAHLSREVKDLAGVPLGQLIRP
ncbi:AraC family transcriptional regulator [Actinosynnema sp. NPDC047251]|uniref:Transcriptional regulator, AraC family n=1 Tax=Saccharothrix espanaensis (strain ATCC 51144 / DSM 44229 / JCM 9112 / NBRC 15066 / NRRL 15764) TaxID=1179773 RepID=K0JV34_SACES|nr:AraC family transcriptional regulator [Saccharothrix espanaensis]CCH28604.1 Transcriptional regulator, AraC family [Saccharothrix espanaensis DSM 44229]